MKKIYTTFLASLACLTAFDASAYKVTVEVDNPSAVELKLSNGTPIVLTNGVGEAEYDSYDAINITATGDYLISDVKTKPPLPLRGIRTTSTIRKTTHSRFLLTPTATATRLRPPTLKRCAPHR